MFIYRSRGPGSLNDGLGGLDGGDVHDAYSTDRFTGQLLTRFGAPHLSLATVTAEFKQLVTEETIANGAPNTKMVALLELIQVGADAVK